MGSDEPLLDVAVALSDGAPVDWDSAARSVTSEDDGRLLAELRFIADMARLTRAELLGPLYVNVRCEIETRTCAP